jgi:hypothetical protein
MPEKDLPEIPAAGLELRFPDLSLPHDLSDPVICLLGIENYCNVLIGSYEKSARRWWQAEDSAADSYKLVRQGNEVSEVVGDDFKELQRHAQVYRGVCEQWQAKLCELTEAASRAMPETLLSCKVLKLHPDQLYRRDNNTEWPAFNSDLKRLQVEAHRLVVSMQEPKALAEAIRSFLHQIGWMRSRQQRLAEKSAMFQQMLALGEHDRELHKLVDELIAEIEAARKKSQMCRDKVLALAILPPHPIDGLSPQEWRFRVSRDANELTTLVGGQYSDAKTNLSDAEEKRFVELYQALDGRSREADNFIDVPIKEAGQVHNYYHGPVDQRQQTINAAGNSGPILANMAGDKLANNLSIKSTRQRSRRPGLWQWLGKPVIVTVVGAIAVGSLKWYWGIQNPPTHVSPLPTTAPALRVTNSVP